MLCIISPAKILDTQKAAPFDLHTQAQFLDKSKVLMNSLRQLTPPQLAQLMQINDQLAALNVARYQEWSTPFHLHEVEPFTKQAIFMFAGEVYRGFKAYELTENEMKKAQEKLRILSGLYGMLKPLDLIQPYRLEMGVALKNPEGENLYDFWRNTLTKAIGLAIDKSGGEKALVNLASNEYFKVIDKKTLQRPIVSPQFKQTKQGQLKTIVSYTKNARGSMARWIIQNNIDTLEDIKSFDADGYQFNKSLSSSDCWTFVR